MVSGEMKLLVVLFLAIAAAQAAENQIYGEDAFLEQSATLRNLYEEKGIDTRAPRVVGGSLATAGQFPFIVTLTISSGISSVICGGTVHSATTVLTAAHCVDGRSSARASGGSIKRTASDSNRQTVSSTSFRIHGSWNSNTLVNDIAIIRLSGSFTLGGAVRAIAIPSSDSNQYAGSTGTIVGWGRTETSSGAVEDLRYTSDTILSHAQCQSSWGSSVRDTMICLNASNRRGSCNGDSGGPLIVGNVQVGITSFVSSAGCTSGYPSVYTRTSKYISWINQNSL